MSPECRRVLEADAVASLPAELEAHVRTCAACQVLRGAGRPAGSPGMGDEISASAAQSLREQVAAALIRRPRARPWWQPALALGLMHLAVAGAAIALLGRSERSELAPCLSTLPLATLLTAVIALGGIAALAPVARKLRAGILATAGLGAAGVIFWATGASDARGFLEAGIPCLRTELALAIAPLSVGLWLLRDSAFGWSKALALGSSSGAVGLLALHLHCPLGTIDHLAVFHLAPFAAVALLAGWLRRKIPTRSFAP